MKNNNIFPYKKIHMIGIGGVSMSSLAELMNHFGYIVTGSDTKESSYTNQLKNIGLNIQIGHHKELIDNADLIVYTAAIPKTDPEFEYAKELNKPMMERSKFLGEITKNYEECICVSGTHGKTTTTSMVASCFLEAKKDPTIEIGSYFKAIQSNNKIGNSEYFILESCEYVDSFLEFHPHAEIILNIDNDHLDYFKNLDNIKASFGKFIDKLNQTGVLVINADDKNCLDVINHAKCEIRTYGIENQDAHWIAKNIKKDSFGYPTFDVYCKNEYYINITLNVLGTHNILNALATTALCDFYNISKEDIKNGLNKFAGANRRFEKIGTYKNIPVIDDYAHHPTEIKTTLESAKNVPHHETWAIFEPHTYSRVDAHKNDFAEVLKHFDHILLAPIYAAREINTSGISSEDIENIIKKDNPNCQTFQTYEEIISWLKEHVQENDLIITIGAGTINQVGYELIKE